MDSPSAVVAKWQTAMRATVDSASFGHCLPSFDSVAGKFSAAYDRDLAYGTFDNVFYQVDRNYGDDPAKTSLGLYITNSPNLFRQTNMAPREFPNVALCAYVFVGSNEILRTQEALGILASFYPQIYRPVVRVCGAAINIQAAKFENVSFQSIYGRAANGATVDVVNSIERLENKVFLTDEYVNLVSCTATADSWLVTTDNASGTVQAIVTPAYNPATVRGLTKESPAFIDTNTITTSASWTNATAFAVVASSAYQSNSAYAADKALDKSTGTYWGTSENAYNSSGNGLHFLTISYPSAVELTGFRISPGTFYSAGTSAPLQWMISGSNTGSSFAVVESFNAGTWVDNTP
ncbi:hypothetical protein T492DRAFT_848301 [Pavlovales sp. CCMP2436]|nr:hypothetical protein T492DRAFT_848301 [Pavlovales sp. CCMP2436]